MGEPFLRALQDRVNPRKESKPNYDALRAQIVSGPVGPLRVLSQLMPWLAARILDVTENMHTVRVGT